LHISKLSGFGFPLAALSRRRSGSDFGLRPSDFPLMPPPPKNRFWHFCRICFRRFRLMLWLLILGSLGALIYVNQIGLPGVVKKPLLEKLRARGIDLQFSRLRLTWDRGIVAEQVRFGRSDNAWGPKMKLSEVQLQLNHDALAHFRFQIDSLLLRHGNLVWPLEQTNAPARQLAVQNI